MHGGVIGRDDLLDQARAALSSTGRLLLEGPAGIGKSTLFRALVERAAGEGVPVLRCAPAEAESTLPLAALADLLAPVAGDVDALPAPQRHAARVALLLEHDAAPVDERALSSATRALLAAAAARSPQGLLLAIDDAPWLDPPSERALRFALRRSPPGVRVLVTRRGADGAAPPLDLDAQHDIERMTLTSLGVGPLHHVLAERFGVRLSRPMITRLARESGGNPLLAIELTRALLRLERMPGPGDDLPVPVSMQDLVAATLAQLDADGVRTARLAALLAVPHLGDLRAAGVADAALDAVEEAGLLSVEPGGRVRFGHATYASAVRAGIPTGVRRGLHASLADTCTDADERARHLAQCTTGTDTTVAAMLAAAAGRARARGAPEQAAELYERAAELAEDDTAYRLRGLYCHFDCGNYPLVAEQLDHLVGGLRDDPLGEALLLRAAVAFAVDDLPLAIGTGERALAVVAASSRLAGRIHAHLAVFTHAAGAAREHAETALRLLDGPAPAAPAQWVAALGGTDEALLTSALMLVFLNEVRAGLPPRVDVLERALVLEAGTPSHLAGTVAAIWWKGTDQHERARARLLTMLDLAVAAGDEPLQHELIQHLAEAETLAGRYDAAAGWVTRSHEFATQLGAGAAAERWLAGMLGAFRGDAAAADDAGPAEASDDPWLRRLGLQLAAFAALADGRTDVAASTFADLAAAMDASGLVEPLGCRYEADWVEACVGAGDLATARVALERLAARHDRLPRPWTALGLARSRVLLDSAAGADTAASVDALLAARDATPADVVPFDRARCLLVAGVAHRRARRRGAARDALAAAAREFEALGAHGFAARARAEADRVGGRGAAPDELSPSELRVAELAAGGATNKQIADALFIAPKTVEANLARIFRKLAINRRVELVSALEVRAQAQT